MRPFFVGQITRISQFAAVVPPAILRRPHRCPPNQVTTIESQTIHMTQDDFGQTLRAVHAEIRQTLWRRAPEKGARVWSRHQRRLFK
jgi:hypothetical protein